MRTCRKCGETKPLDEFDRRADTGKLRTECKACRRARQRLPVNALRPRTKFVVGTDELLRCRSCGLYKPASEFPKRGRESDRLQTWCKACFAAYKARRHQENHEREMRRIRRNEALHIAENRAFVRAYLLSHPCVDCGERDPIVLEFDHVRGEKLGDVSAIVNSGRPLRTVEAEIAKCEVRCANCHRRVTQLRRQQARVSEELILYVSATPEGLEPSTDAASKAAALSN